MKPLDRHCLQALKLLALRGQSTRPEMVAAMPIGLSRLHHVLAVLEEADLLAGQDSASGRQGRPVRTWNLNPEAGEFLVVYAGERHTYYSWRNYSGAPMETLEASPASDTESLLEQIADAVNRRTRPPVGIMLVLSGIVDSDAGSVVLSYRWGLKEAPLASRLAGMIDGPDKPLIRVENDAHAAAVAEKRSTASSDSLMTLFVQGQPAESGGVYFGCGVIWEGRLMKGRLGGMGEFGLDYRKSMDAIQAESGGAALADYPAGLRRRLASELGQTLAQLMGFFAIERLVVQYVEQEPLPVFTSLLDEAINAHWLEDSPLQTVVETSDRNTGAVFRGAGRLLREQFFSGSQQVIDAIERVTAVAANS